jgi:hypothetical protein
MVIFAKQVVLAGGKLTEYTGWRESLEVHGTPINLRFASARESRAPDGRRFTFEVLTPQVRRIYQATSDEEASQWIQAISNNIESLLNGWGFILQCFFFFRAERMWADWVAHFKNEFGAKL